MPLGSGRPGGMTVEEKEDEDSGNDAWQEERLVVRVSIPAESTHTH